jgi:putative tricarboxylic transport membrane protein
MLIGVLRRRALLALALPAALLALAACGAADRGGSSSGDDSGFATSRLSIMAPADPGGGWDETARALQKAARDAKLANSGVEVYNVPGAGGTIGLSQLITKHGGDARQLMVMGLVMLGAIETNKSAVNLSKVTPIAKLTEESEAIVVPAKSKYTSFEQLVADLKRDPAKVSFAGGSAGGSDQILLGLIAKAAGVDPRDTKYVAYSGGGEATAAILSGSVKAGSRASASSPTRSRRARCACSPCRATASRSTASPRRRSGTRGSTSSSRTGAGSSDRPD